MAAGSRLSARLLLAVVMTGLAMSLGTLNVQAAASPLAITAHVGYADTIKVGQWVPISIAITNNGPQVDGTLGVQSSFAGKPPVAWPATYERPMVVAAGEEKKGRGLSRSSIATNGNSRSSPGRFPALKQIYGG
jgi:hypothetical protein